jgi:predicted transcriptional regulator of viral defense system
MKTIELLEKLKTKPVFRVQDIERIAFCNRKYAKLLLNRLKKNGYVKRVSRNAYTTKDDIFVIASNITSPSYISFWSASFFLGYTEQIVNTVFIATTRRFRAISFEGYRIEFVPIKHFFGYKKTRTNEGELFMAEDEKLLIDAFLRPKKCGNFDEIEKMFENAKIEEGRLISYLKRTGSQAVIKKVGFLLEKTRGIDLSGNFRLDRNYATLDPFSEKGKKTDAKWRVRI